MSYINEESQLKYMDDFDKILVTRKTGNEPFIESGNPIQNDFCRFGSVYQIMLSGEYIVTLAINGAKGVRIEWESE